jgi:hypothetical protein
MCEVSVLLLKELSHEGRIDRDFSRRDGTKRHRGFL